MIINRNILLARRIDDKGEDRAALIRMDRNEKIDPFNKSILNATTAKRILVLCIPGNIASK